MPAPMLEERPIGVALSWRSISSERWMPSAGYCLACWEKQPEPEVAQFEEFGGRRTQFYPDIVLMYAAQLERTGVLCDHCHMPIYKKWLLSMRVVRGSHMYRNITPGVLLGHILIHAGLWRTYSVDAVPYLAPLVWSVRLDYEPVRYHLDWLAELCGQDWTLNTKGQISFVERQQPQETPWIDTFLGLMERK